MRMLKVGPEKKPIATVVYPGRVRMENKANGKHTLPTGKEIDAHEWLAMQQIAMKRFGLSLPQFHVAENYLLTGKKSKAGRMAGVRENTAQMYLVHPKVLKYLDYRSIQIKRAATGGKILTGEQVLEELSDVGRAEWKDPTTNEPTSKGIAVLPHKVKALELMGKATGVLQDAISIQIDHLIRTELGKLTAKGLDADLVLDAEDVRVLESGTNPAE